MSRNYGYGPTRNLGNAALRRTITERGLGAVAAGDAGIAFGAALLLSNPALHSALLSRYPSIFDSEAALTTVLNDLSAFHYDTMSDWATKFASYPSKSPFVAVTPHAATASPGDDKTDLGSWRIDLSAAGIGGLNLTTL